MCDTLQEVLLRVLFYELSNRWVQIKEQIRLSNFVALNVGYREAHTHASRKHLKLKDVRDSIAQVFFGDGKFILLKLYNSISFGNFFYTFYSNILSPTIFTFIYCCYFCLTNLRFLFFIWLHVALTACMELVSPIKSLFCNRILLRFSNTLWFVLLAFLNFFFQILSQESRALRSKARQRMI